MASRAAGALASAFDAVAAGGRDAARDAARVIDRAERGGLLADLAAVAAEARAIEDARGGDSSSSSAAEAAPRASALEGESARAFASLVRLGVSASAFASAALRSVPDAGAVRSLVRVASRARAPGGAASRGGVRHRRGVPRARSREGGGGGGAGANRSQNQHSHATRRAFAKAATARGAIAALRDLVAEDDAAPRTVSAALDALAALLGDASSHDPEAGSPGGGYAEAPRKHVARLMVDERLVPAVVAALDPARPGTVLNVEAAERSVRRVSSSSARLDASSSSDASLVALHASRLLRLPFDEPLPPPGASGDEAEAALRRYQETLLNEAVVASVVQALDALTQSAARDTSHFTTGEESAPTTPGGGERRAMYSSSTPPSDVRVSGAAALTGVLSQLVLRSPSYAKQFVDAGGVAPALLRRTLHPTLNAPSALIDALLAVSQLARLGAEHYPAIKRADAVGLVAPLLSHRDAGVRARACNALGNMCRHSGFFYDDFADRGALTGLIERCGDSDRTTRKFACFAIGNAGFHGDRLYAHLAEAAAPLTALLRDEEEKTRANAAAALGNLVRNSDALCSDLIRAGALEALVELATGGYDAGAGGAKKGDGSGGGGGGGGGESQSPVKIALFSLGNLCAHADCRAKLLALGFERKIAALADAEDASVRRYVARIEGKIAGGEARGRGRTDAARREREA